MTDLHAVNNVSTEGKTQGVFLLDFRELQQAEHCSLAQNPREQMVKRNYM